MLVSTFIKDCDTAKFLGYSKSKRKYKSAVDDEILLPFIISGKETCS